MIIPYALSIRTSNTAYVFDIHGIVDCIQWYYLFCIFASSLSSPSPRQELDLETDAGTAGLGLHGERA